MTAQIPENLIYEGYRTTMNFCPFLPEDHPRIVELSREEIKRENIHPMIFSTACWRQYVGTWEVKNGQFYLVHLTGKYKILGDDPIPADWFSGVLKIPVGKILHYVHMGFGTVYEREIFVTIEKGKVVDVRVKDNRGKEVDHWDRVERNMPGSEFRSEDEKENGRSQEN